MADELHVHIVGPNGPAVLVPEPGAFEPGQPDRLIEAVRDLIEDGIRSVVVNLAAIRYLDSAGIGILLGCAQSLRAEGGALGLIGVRTPLRNVLSAAMVLHVVPVFRSVEDAASGLPSDRKRE